MTDDYLRTALRDLVCLRFGVDPGPAGIWSKIPVDLPKQYQALTAENKATVASFVRSLYLVQRADQARAEAERGT